MMIYDKVILGAGLYGLYAALLCAKKGERVLVLEYDPQPFLRASWINQARVHYGYHYPRSYSTALKSIHYFNRFIEEFEYAILKDFQKIYATSKYFSWTNAKQFQSFCKKAEIPCEPVDSELFFKPHLCDGAFSTQEYTFDANRIAEELMCQLKTFSRCEIKFDTRTSELSECIKNKTFKLTTNQGSFETRGLINATYASVNQILTLLGQELIEMKYELCEVALCRVSPKLQNIGLTVMDGAFFSLMPFGKSGFHSLTAVEYTPHATSYEALPTFSCQSPQVECSPTSLNNCHFCPNRPGSAFKEMSTLARKYLQEDIEIFYDHSLFSMKAILKSSEVNDARPTLIKKHTESPDLISIFSGKINTIYDLDEVLG